MYFIEFDNHVKDVITSDLIQVYQPFMCLATCAEPFQLLRRQNIFNL